LLRFCMEKEVIGVGRGGGQAEAVATWQQEE
jgi:hypothetical protein